MMPNVQECCEVLKLGVVYSIVELSRNANLYVMQSHVVKAIMENESIG